MSCDWHSHFPPLRITFLAHDPQLLKLICLTAFHLRNCRQLLNTVTLVLTWCIHLICWLSLAHSQTPTHTLFPPLCLTCDSSQLNGVDLLCLSPSWLIYLHLTAAIAVAHSSDAWDAGSNPANWKMAQLIALLMTPMVLDLAWGICTVAIIHYHATRRRFESCMGVWSSCAFTLACIDVVIIQTHAHSHAFTWLFHIFYG